MCFYLEIESAQVWNGGIHKYIHCQTAKILNISDHACVYFEYTPRML